MFAALFVHLHANFALFGYVFLCAISFYVHTPVLRVALLQLVDQRCSVRVNVRKREERVRVTEKQGEKEREN